jgi:hypothetical protein
VGTTTGPADSRGGRAILAHADQGMSSQGIRNPDRMTALFVPWTA